MGKYNLVTDAGKASMNGDLCWNELATGIDSILRVPEIAASIDREHLQQTPERVTKMMREEFFSGCFHDPKSVLSRTFKSKEDEMVYVNDIHFVSFCAHHLVPFVGKVHFAYIPNGRIVGLSKIPRLIEILAHRPQVQEKLTGEIVDNFQEVLKPKGCGVVIEAVHFCMMIRGVKKETAYTKTNALRGCFKNAATRYEFLDGVKHGGTIWP